MIVKNKKSGKEEHLLEEDYTTLERFKEYLNLENNMEDPVAVKKFLLHWLDGKTEEVMGVDINDAFTTAGYGAGAVKALDYWEEINSSNIIR